MKARKPSGPMAAMTRSQLKNRHAPVPSAVIAFLAVCTLLAASACAGNAAPAEVGAPDGTATEGDEELSVGDGGGDADAEEEAPEVDPETLDDCVTTPVAGEPGAVFVTSPAGWQVKTREGQEFECSDEFSSVNYRPGLAAIIHVQPKGPDAPVAKQVSGFAAAVRDSWQKQHGDMPNPKLLGHKVGRDKRPAVCLELPEPGDEGVKIGCVTAKEGPHDTIVYHYSQFYLKVADFEANKEAAWEAVHDLAGEWNIIGAKKTKKRR